jgi:hypothetical protein
MQGVHTDVRRCNGPTARRATLTVPGTAMCEQPPIRLIQTRG